jgi:hypothetical protein
VEVHARPPFGADANRGANVCNGWKADISRADVHNRDAQLS